MLQINTIWKIINNKLFEISGILKKWLDIKIENPKKLDQFIGVSPQ